MKQMLLAVFTVAAVGLSAGAALAHQTVVCQPVCGLVGHGEAQNLKENNGKKNAATHMSQQGLNHNNAGIGPASPPPPPGPVVLF